MRPAYQKHENIKAVFFSVDISILFHFCTVADFSWRLQDAKACQWDALKISNHGIFIQCWFLRLLTIPNPFPMKSSHPAGKCHCFAVSSGRWLVLGGSTCSHRCVYTKKMMFSCSFCHVLVLCRCICIWIILTLSSMKVVWPSRKKGSSLCRCQKGVWRFVSPFCAWYWHTTGNTKRFIEVGMIWHLITLLWQMSFAVSFIIIILTLLRQKRWAGTAGWLLP